MDLNMVPGIWCIVYCGLWYTKTRILETRVSGIALVLGLRTRPQDPYVHTIRLYFGILFCTIHTITYHFILYYIIQYHVLLFLYHTILFILYHVHMALGTPDLQMA